MVAAKKRVVVTGLGTLTPVGLNTVESWQSILAGKSGTALIEAFDTSNYTTRICASLKGFDVSNSLSVKDARKIDYFAQYALVAAAEAIEDANFTVDPATAHRVGIAIGSGIGGLPMSERNYQAWLNGGPRRISPFFIPGAIINMAAGYLTMKYGLKGPSIAIVTACTTGAHNIGYAARTIAYGDADVMLAGGTEMAISPMGVGGFAAMRALSTRNDEPARASRPWDKDRDGFVLGEGAGVMLLESYEHAMARGAKIYAELVGFGMSSDAAHMTLPDEGGLGQAQAIKNALADANYEPSRIDYINAHSTSTLAGDEIELRAIKNAFGAHAMRTAISSTKSMTGHLLGAAGSVEAIFSVLALRDNIAPPTINLENPCDEAAGMDLVPNQARKMPINTVMSNSFGFGGTNASLIFTRVS